MTDRFENLRIFKKYVDSSSNPNAVKNRSFLEGDVVARSDNGRKVKVKILPDKIETWCRVSFNKYSDGTQVGSVPEVGSRVLLAIIDSSNDVYENLVVLAEIPTNDTEKVERTSGAEDDTSYHAITPKNGGKIEFFKDGDEINRLWITGLGKIDIKSQDDINIVVENNKKFNVDCEKVSLGDPNLSSTQDKIVKQPHLDNHNAMANAVSTILSNLGTQPFLGDMGIPIPFAVRMASYTPAVVTPYETTKSTDIIDNDNITSKVWAK